MVPSLWLEASNLGGLAAGEDFSLVMSTRQDGTITKGPVGPCGPMHSKAMEQRQLHVLTDQLHNNNK